MNLIIKVIYLYIFEIWNYEPQYYRMQQSLTF